MCFKIVIFLISITIFYVITYRIAISTSRTHKRGNKTRNSRSLSPLAPGANKVILRGAKRKRQGLRGNSHVHKLKIEEKEPPGTGT